MSHFAYVLNGEVKSVIVAEQDFIDSLPPQPGRWIQTSYNTHGGVHYDQDGNPDGGQALRKNYAGIGYLYLESIDAFVPPCPDPVFVLNEETGLWEPPTSYPQDGQGYHWNRQAGEWELTDQSQYQTGESS